jgi:hypothetical protein
VPLLSVLISATFNWQTQTQTQKPSALSALEVPLRESIGSWYDMQPSAGSTLVVVSGEWLSTISAEELRRGKLSISGDSGAALPGDRTTSYRTLDVASAMAQCRTACCNVSAQRTVGCSAEREIIADLSDQSVAVATSKEVKLNVTVKTNLVDARATEAHTITASWNYRLEGLLHSDLTVQLEQRFYPYCVPSLPKQIDVPIDTAQGQFSTISPVKALSSAGVTRVTLGDMRFRVSTKSAALGALMAAQPSQVMGCIFPSPLQMAAGGTFHTSEFPIEDVLVTGGELDVLLLSHQALGARVQSRWSAGNDLTLTIQQ